ncbi:MAG: hypothetical protein EHM73_07230 [Chroococcales cyanobacterium metabat2.561]|nr:MAG: hypothetical protein EHM73_07230 [Chroococcales cyanobacterium metabat2.561]
MNEGTTTVEEFYPLHFQLIERAIESDYYEVALQFYEKIKHKTLRELTKKQRAWLEDMVEHLEENP